MVAETEYEGNIELPKIKTSNQIPEKVTSFSRAMSQKCNDFNCFVMFYEHDIRFERLWNNPKRYLNKLKKFKGVISPDFSLYRNMPLVMQMWNTYRGRALGVWLQNNGIEVIPNVRFSDERSFSFCFDGVEKNKTIAIGTHGCIKNKVDRLFFKTGIAVLVKQLSPKTIIVYGRAPDEIFKKYKNDGIEIVAFESEFAKSRRQVDA